MMMSRLLSEVKDTLLATGCTLAVGKGAEILTFTNRGVADLVYLLDNNPSLLNGASVADKIIGKAAASLMITGGVKEVYTPKITAAAAEMFRQTGIPVEYEIVIPMVENRTKTGRCPLDTLCSPLSSPLEMVAAIRHFLRK